jgi:D-alanine--D-alanine ligase
MRIALTYNLRRDASEACAEFDSIESIEAIADIVRGLGHHVTPLDVTGSIPRLVAGLRWIRPELVLNLAEGERGPFREAFYPALFEQLGYAYTGSSPSTLALCLDKALAKRVVAAAGVSVPERGVAPPWIVKPNFEGSSKGIAGIVTERDELEPRVAELLARYPDGVLVEELVPGEDVAVAWVDGIGVLPPIAYRHGGVIYDYALKQADAARVVVEVPARLPSSVTAKLYDAATRAFAALGVRGLGRADFRVTPEGEVVFLEMNPLPALGPEDKELYAASALLGKTPGELFAAILAA